jgi:hypothetical protein
MSYTEKYELLPKIVSQVGNEGASYVYGKVLSGDVPVNGIEVWYAWEGNQSPAIEKPIISGPHAGYRDWPDGFFSVPVLPLTGHWDFWFKDPKDGTETKRFRVHTGQDGATGSEVQIQVQRTLVGYLTSGNVIDVIIDLAWRQMGLMKGSEHNPDSALVKYARSAELGAPLTAEVQATINGVIYVFQGFAMGIPFAVMGKWSDVNYGEW